MLIVIAVAAAEAAGIPANFSNFILYVPVPNTQSQNGTAQFFLGYQKDTPIPPIPYSNPPGLPDPPAVPEPGSLILLAATAMVARRTRVPSSRRALRRRSVCPPRRVARP